MTPASASSQHEPLPTSVFLAIFSAVFLPMFLAAVDQTLLATATPAIVEDLGGLRQASWITIGYMLAMAASVPIYGWLGDNFGRAKILMIALVVFALGSVVSASASTMDHMIAGRILQGLGGGGLMSLSQSLVGELVPIRQRARFQGYFAVYPRQCWRPCDWWLCGACLFLALVILGEYSFGHAGGLAT